MFVSYGNSAESAEAGFGFSKDTILTDYLLRKVSVEIRLLFSVLRHLPTTTTIPIQTDCRIKLLPSNGMLVGESGRW
jgi:hypothetical protein